MSNLVDYARMELEAAGWLKDEGMYGDLLGKAVMELVEKFSEQGHSGNSAPAVIKLFSKVAMYEPLGPITGEDFEWQDAYLGPVTQQNKRCFALFKDKDGKVTYSDAILKRDQRGISWRGRAWLTREDYESGDRSKMISSSQEIFGFPFTPKTFTIDVIDEEVAPDDWEPFVKDPSQLEEVWKYYKKPY
jgi:hypothetical protein